jgi:DNA-binding MarR family transcriptional regulator
MAVDHPRSSEDCNCYAVRAAARHVTQYYDQFLAPARLRTTQFSILAKLKLSGPLTISELADAMAMDRTTLGRNIRPLQRDRLMKIESAASDRRMKVLRVTKAGEKRFEAARREWSVAQVRFEKVFGAARAAELRALLRAVVATELVPQTMEERNSLRSAHRGRRPSTARIPSCPIPAAEAFRPLKDRGASGAR